MWISMIRAIPAVLIALLLVAPGARAQQLTEQEAQRIAQGLLEQFNKAAPAKDTAKIGDMFTEDAIRVGVDDTAVGRAQIEKRYADGFRTFDSDPAKIERVKVLDRNAFAAIGTWSGTTRGPKPVRMTGGWSDTVVRVGNTWKIAVLMVNMSPQQ